MEQNKWHFTGQDQFCPDINCDLYIFVFVYICICISLYLYIFVFVYLCICISLYLYIFVFVYFKSDQIAENWRNSLLIIFCFICDYLSIQHCKWQRWVIKSLFSSKVGSFLWIIPISSPRPNMQSSWIPTFLVMAFWRERQGKFLRNRVAIFILQANTTPSPPHTLASSIWMATINGRQRDVQTGNIRLLPSPSLSSHQCCLVLTFHKINAFLSTNAHLLMAAWSA